MSTPYTRCARRKSHRVNDRGRKTRRQIGTNRKESDRRQGALCGLPPAVPGAGSGEKAALEPEHSKKKTVKIEE